MYDLIVIGGGPAGYVGAIKAAKSGMKTMLIESGHLGGTCLNRGCIPMKSLLHASGEYSKILNVEHLGIEVSGLKFDFKKMQENKNKTIGELRQGIMQLLIANGVDIVNDKAAIKNCHEVAAGDKLYETKRILLSSGSVPVIPAIPGADLPGVVGSDEILEKDIPLFDRLIIIGGGVIGVETASLYNSLGREVTILEIADRLLPMMDKEISQNIRMIFKKRGINVKTSVRVEDIHQTVGGLVCRCYGEKEEEACEADGILIAAGRKACVDGLFDGCEAPELEKGYFLVDDHFETSEKNIFAVGDCNGKMQLAHAAEAQAMAAVDYMTGKKEPSVDPNVVPSCIYTEPEIGCVGITEEDAKGKGLHVMTGKYVMRSNAKIMMENSERSFIKIVVEKETEKVIGAQMMCPRATDMIGEMTEAVVNGMMLDQVLKVLRPHPTFAEGISEAIESVNGEAIHNMPAKLKGRRN